MTDEKLARGIGRTDLIAITINSIIGAGIFGLPSKAAALATGANSLLAFVACALVVGLIVFCFAEVSSRFAATGGSYLYAKSAFGSIVGFEVGWLFWLVRITAFATNCNLLIAYLGLAKEGFARVAVIVLVILILTAVNFVGVKSSARMINFFTVGKLVPLFLFAVVGLFFVESANINFTASNESNNFAGAILILVYAFTGFEMAVVPSGEMKNPQKILPVALLISVAVVAALYILIQTVCLGTLPELAQSERPIADAAGKFAGAFGSGFIVVGAIISISGNLNSLLLSASRVPFAMAEQNELPQIFARINAKYKTPYISIFLTALVMLVFTLQTSFLTALTISTITRLVVYATTCAALPVFRFKKDAPPAEFLAPLGTLAAVLSLILIAWLLWNVKVEEFTNILIVAGIGLLVYFAYYFVNRRLRN